jgi:hypothetical protein
MFSRIACRCPKTMLMGVAGGTITEVSLHLCDAGKLEFCMVVGMLDREYQARLESYCEFLTRWRWGHVGLSIEVQDRHGHVREDWAFEASGLRKID